MFCVLATPIGGSTGNVTTHFDEKSSRNTLRNHFASYGNDTDRRCSISRLNDGHSVAQSGPIKSNPKLGAPNQIQSANNSHANRTKKVKNDHHNGHVVRKQTYYHYYSEK
ncbi:hypothetical protein Zmor_011538 [Zophobas morio]|uniref:Uncharacterized protein n=1 Tax=Zophobas morio TaxID=2755281 RepID=A0AA38IQA4_9CUCU|nr:hypothetical protein Zmor_011538 [Zophobas morio]